MGNPIRVLHIFGRMQTGGAEMRTLDLMRHLDRQRYKLDYCTLSGLPGVLDDQIQALGGRVHPCQIGPTFPTRFRRLLRRERYNVVHSHVHLFSGYLVRLAAMEGTPVRISHFRSMADGHQDNLRRRIQRALMRRWIDRYATHILAVCEGAMLFAWGANWPSDPRCRVIYNGLDLAAFEGPADPVGIRREFSLSEDCRLYIHVGRISPEKNHRRLISVFDLLARRDPMARLVLVAAGGNETEQRVCEQVHELGLSGRVILAGSRSDVPRLIKASDLMIFPSLREGLPGAVLEACAAGTPVLASDLPGVREIAAHFPMVRYLPLEAGDETWASTAEALRVAPGLDRDAEANWFECSPFAMEDCVAAHCTAWKGR